MMGKKLTEKDTRSKLLDHAKRIGATDDLKRLFDKWDRALALAPRNEVDEMSKLAILEVQRLLDIHAEEGLTINNEIVIPEKGEK
jgi:hypothetical protein